MPAPSRRTRTVQLLLLLVSAGVAALLSLDPTLAAFWSRTTSTNNGFAAGSVMLRDNDAGGAMFSLSGLKPGDADSGCIAVTYDGSLPATVRLYASSPGTGAQRYLGLTITRGTLGGAPVFDSCTGFTADAATYVAGQAPGVVYAGPLDRVPADWASGLNDPTTASPESWTTGETHAYRLQLTLGDNAAARGSTTSPAFTWEARS